MRPRYCLKICGCILLACLFQHIAPAQLKADFDMDKPGGCSPLVTQFTNQTTGASSNATYEWDFGNGNTSALSNPSGVFINENEYSVTLTVKDGDQSSTKTKTVTVYQKPQIDFSASAQKGCTPLTVTFTANAKANNGNIISYLWDYGDGFTSYSNSSQSKHTYETGQNASVTLSVTDNHGCTESRIVPNMIEVLPGVRANFEADKTFICKENDPVNLIDKSISENPLTYLWDFGDGATSTEKTPSHSFNKKGSFNVKLAIKSSLGCTSEVTKTGYLNVGNYQSEISVPDKICKNTFAEIKNVSTPAPTSFTFTVNGSNIYTDYQAKYMHPFYNAGDYKIELTNHFGECVEKVTKVVTVKELLQPKGFITEIEPYCTMPAKVTFTDTTKGAVKSQWAFDNFMQIAATGKSVTHNYLYPGLRYATLYVTDANGCTNSVSKNIFIEMPEVFVRMTDEHEPYGCDELTKTFSIQTNVELASFTWHFGDGTTSTEREPTHTFKPGKYEVYLKYTTIDGCQGESSRQTITVTEKPKADFVSLTGTQVCGNDLVTFERRSPKPGSAIQWLIDGQSVGYFNNPQLKYQFTDTGWHSISMIEIEGGCGDTLTRTDYIRVLPSIPKVTSTLNTCDNDRGTITFTQHSIGAKKWEWNFGDGSTKTVTQENPVMEHNYKKSGTYTVELTTSNGACVNKTSTTVMVLMKQKPVLSVSKTTVCEDEAIAYQITDLDNNPVNYSADYSLESYQYGNEIRNPYYYPYPLQIKGMPFQGMAPAVEQQEKKVRIIMRSLYFNCLDTTNFVPLTLKGATAGFEILNNNSCFGSTMQFRDISVAGNTNISSRVWNFDDGTTYQAKEGEVVSHKYQTPGQYNVSLQITDASGCTTSSSNTSEPVFINGPKAAFSVSETNAHLNSTIHFYNNTNNFNSYNTTYEWHFGDGNKSNAYSPSYTYKKPGTYKIMLVVKGGSTGCTDTAYQTISVKNFNVNFSISTSYVDTRECGSVLAKFYNSSQNHTSVKWDFGDGTTSVNNNYPSHIYTKPGTYIVKLFVTGHNGLSNTYIDSVVIGKQEVQFKADAERTCTSEFVTFATSGNDSLYLWDLGDGNTVRAAEASYVHQYKKPGVYYPRLIITKENGCIAAASLSEKIIIDSLAVALHVQENICTPREMSFYPRIVNAAGDKSSPPLAYHWNFGTGNSRDTSNVAAPSFEYRQPGDYVVNLKVQSPYGCAREISAKITAHQGLGAKLIGPASVCEQAVVEFEGATQIAGRPEWKWIFEDGSEVQQQHPPKREYNKPGEQIIRLIVNNSGCADTIVHTLTVHAKPVVDLARRDVMLCEGSSVTLTAGGGQTYSWSPANGLNTNAGAAVLANPLVDSRYVVTVTDVNGCMQKDSVNVSVVHPFKLELTPEAAICKGESVQLKASGGDVFLWIENTAGLSEVAVGSPMASPVVNTVYTLTARDSHHCFADTASVLVQVRDNPVVDAGTGATLLMGSPFQLQASGGSDVVNWKWSPSKYLNCTECAAPVATPQESMIYTVTGTNTFGCSASDTVSLTLFCSAARIFIPNAFTPNGDGLNDNFGVLGAGIGVINYLKIFDRWGKVVFERSNFKADDRLGKWDGKFRGEPSPAGLYHFIVEMSCNEKTYTQKGTVTLIR